MDDVIGFTLDDGTIVAVQAPRRDGSSPVGLREKLQPSEKTLRAALAPVTAAASQVLDDFRKAAHQPQEIEISFGVELDGKLGGVIASANAGTHLDVTLRWRAPSTEDQEVHDPRKSGAESVLIPQGSAGR
jgi:Trypsin-co-occurring domain 1